MITKLNFSKTCLRFCKLINKYAKEITHCQFIGFLSFRKFANIFKFKFYEKYVQKSDQFYMNYVLRYNCRKDISPYVLVYTVTGFYSIVICA